MIPAVFINCDVIPFLDRIIALDKPIETRTRNMLRSLVHQRVLLTETHRGRKPLCRARATIGTPMAVRSREEWEHWREIACIPANSKYDWQDNTRVKWLYPIYDVVEIEPFTPPEGVRHGRVWMEYNP
jgi:hypothetical protein